ncbi:protein of unknown function [Salegentibacter salegens]|uniref:3-keto-alpha-glucoside-1,2-lyase/3-keto-2-hydroxy-glucal hydratase domain-containing protein n=2 Tax=Salegentibacter salegens TaxID=143223 RepID=A0A1M7IJJ2_9FLAO|nr:DUF1080 domain-containing protein [Salegentibacter salegens]SHM40778.1 protein of unknown function [Salegentibacter salegens]
MKILILRMLVIAISVPLLINCTDKSDKEAFGKPMFSGENFSGWSQKNGNAKYGLEDGVIVGTTVPGTPNSFLATDKKYGDFILELDFKADPSMNSGIQIRSKSKPQYQNNRVHGYQVEIDPSDRAWSGGIYDEARRGWLYPMSLNTSAKNSYKKDDWNHYRIEAIGDTIQTWVNGVAAANLVDDKTHEGFIALQVHSIGNDEAPGKQIRWKNVRIMTDSLEHYNTKSDAPVFNTKNQITSAEKEDGWKLLWDGKSTEAWRGAKLEEFPEKGWVVEDGVLTVIATGGEESTAGGDIVTKKLYGDFELKVDFKITEGANSGIKYYVDTDLNKGPGSSIGLEYQILDDKRHPDAKKGNHEGSRSLASLYDLIKADPNKPVNPIGEWNTAHIISKDGHVEHWLNGMKVLEFDRNSEDFLKLVSESKYEKWPDFGQLEKGQILLQDHGNRVSFKNIKIKSL